MKKQLLLIIIGMFLISFAFAVEVTYCCEKSIDLDTSVPGVQGGWCQDAPEDKCDITSNCGTEENPSKCRKAPTSCDATSYCKLGTCIDSSEGTCMDNTPQKVCEEFDGVWFDEDSEDISQCSLGCCLMGEQAAFVTQTRCKTLSSLYGLETNYRTDLANEFECIASTTSEVKGACVFKDELATTCKFTTQAECSGMNVAGSDTNFYAGKLCSAEELATNCGHSKKTTCVEGRDEVYFLDTCGNLANIYDSSKVDNKEYWSELRDKSEVECGSDSNADSASCGNCDYYLGSTCKKYKRGESPNKPIVGDYICRDLGCEFEGERYEHGETWCAESKGIKENSPGSRYFRLVCYNGDVSVEPCADFRQEVCLQDEINGFRTAGCRVNMWQDCVAQTTSKDCTNTDKRDCTWIGGEGVKCVPKYNPGFDFWNIDTEASATCSVANAQCIAKFEKKLGEDKWQCEENCHCCVNDEEHEGCTGSGWQNFQNSICVQVGDCGSKKNYLGVMGY